jgi:hypothetical protein
MNPTFRNFAEALEYGEVKISGVELSISRFTVRLTASNVERRRWR